MATGDTIEIRHLHNYRRPSEDDILLAWITRESDTDGLFQWNGSGWTLLLELQGTDLIYDSASCFGKVFWCDGKNHIWYFDADTSTTCEITTSPPVQYLIAFQEHL